ncbi:M28 family peptidase [Lysobacter sp. M15]|uniref:M28 family peptidase n=1 Tax=Lysobacter sp. M15 TaxID=2916837 RepID=UPI001F5AC615|nr:M28 family peptidase [Lysobacter sp. M15]
MRLAPLLLALFVASPALAQTPGQTTIPDAALQAASQLREQALADDTAWKVTESLTTEIGPRLAGSEADARAVEWARRKFEALGYDEVWTQPVTFPKWERRSEHGEVLGAYAQPLILAALGGSPGGTVEGEVVRFDSLEALQAAPAGSLAGKIAFVDFAMERARDGRGYGTGSRVRGGGPSAAVRAGASAFLMRSAGTDSHRVAHTGITRFEEGLQPIPAAALSVPDAAQLSRLVARGATRVRVALDCGWDGEYTSHNVIGEITGKRKDEVVVIGGHLDSWDQGTGAIDDAAGIGITMAAGHLIGQRKDKPLRTIRVIAYANEEQGLHGGEVYAKSQAQSIASNQIIAESDFGAGRIYAFNTSSAKEGPAQRASEQIAEALAPLGIAYTPGEGGPGSDAGPSAALGVAWASLRQDGTEYFDLHHTPDDTLDKIDPEALAQNAAAYTVFAFLAAEADGGFGSEAKPVTPPEE